MSATTEEIWQRFGADLRRFIARRVSEPADAEDVLQDVFVKIHARLDTVQDEERVAAWVYQIARNAIVDTHRRHRETWDLSEITALEAKDAPDGTVELEVARWLKPMIDDLPDKYREALWLTEFEGLTQVELAERLGMSVSGAKSRVQRGRSLLRHDLLDCCQFEFDRRGGIIGYRTRIELFETPPPAQRQ